MDPHLRAGFARSKTMLGVSEYPGTPSRQGQPSDELWPELDKLSSLKYAIPTGSPADVRLQPAPIAVTFRGGVNHVGVQQRACVLCGDCCAGCNHAAKNSLLMNYLPDARNNGAELFCGIQVRWVESLPGDAWLVHFELLDPGRERFHPREMFIKAGLVVLGAGSLGSTEILLRSRNRGLSLSAQLGKHFSGNADSIAFGYNNDPPIHGIGLGRVTGDERGSVGPTITGLVDLREPPGAGECSFRKGPSPVQSPLPLGSCCHSWQF